MKFLNPLSGELIVFFFLLSFPFGYGQTLKFQKSFGGDSIPVAPYTMQDGGKWIENTYDGGYIVGGWQGRWGGFNYENGSVIKTDQYGSIIWKNTFGYNSVTIKTKVNSVKETLDSGYIATGYTQFYNDFYDIFLVKMDNSGNILWSKIFGGGNDDEGLDVISCGDNGYIIVGYTKSFGAGAKDAYIIKTDSAGDTLWTRIIGEINNDDARSICGTSDGNYIVAGTSNLGNGKLGAGLVFKLENNGTINWIKAFEGIFNDEFNSCLALNDETIVVAGSTQSFGNGDKNIFLVKLTSEGDTVFTKYFGTNSDDNAYSIKSTYDNGLVMVGNMNGNPPSAPNIYFFKTDQSGEMLWNKVIGENGGDEAFSIVQSADSGFALIGITHIVPNENGDCYLIKADSEGESGCHTYSSISFSGFATIVISLPNLQVSAGSEISNVSFVKINGSRVYTECFLTSEKEEKVHDKFLFYPNPLNEQLNIFIEDDAKGTILDIYGRVMLSTDLTAGNNLLHLNNFPPGNYIIQIISNNRIVTSKIIKL